MPISTALLTSALCFPAARVKQGPAPKGEKGLWVTQWEGNGEPCLDAFAVREFDCSRIGSADAAAILHRKLGFVIHGEPRTEELRNVEQGLLIQESAQRCCHVQDGHATRNCPPIRSGLPVLTLCNWR